MLKSALYAVMECVIIGLAIVAITNIIMGVY